MVTKSRVLDDDVWGGDSDDEQESGQSRGQNDAADLERERLNRTQQHYNAGYRDGLDVGKERTLQQGFDIGYKEGAREGFAWGLTRGAIRALEVCCAEALSDAHMTQQVQALASEAAAIPHRAAALSIFKYLLAQPLEAPPAVIADPELTAAFKAVALIEQATTATATATGTDTTAAPNPTLEVAAASHEPTTSGHASAATATYNESSTLPLTSGTAAALMATASASAVAVPDLQPVMLLLRHQLETLGFDPAVSAV